MQNKYIEWLFEIDFFEKYSVYYYYYKFDSLDLFLHKVNIENNQIDINNRKSVIESETDIRKYIYNRITMFLIETNRLSVMII